MLNTPTIHASYQLTIHLSHPFQSCVTVAHDGLSDIVKAMVDMLRGDVFVVDGERQVLLVCLALVPILQE